MNSPRPPSSTTSGQAPFAPNAYGLHPVIPTMLHHGAPLPLRHPQYPTQVPHLVAMPGTRHNLKTEHSYTEPSIKPINLSIPSHGLSTPGSDMPLDLTMKSNRSPSLNDVPQPKAEAAIGKLSDDNTADAPLDLSRPRSYRSELTSINQPGVETPQNRFLSADRLSIGTPQSVAVIPSSAGESAEAERQSASSINSSLIGDHPQSDILYLHCRVCQLSYGSVHGFRKHFRNMHNYTPTSDDVLIQSISATRQFISAQERTGQVPRFYCQQCGLQFEQSKREVFLQHKITHEGPNRGVFRCAHCLQDQATPILLLKHLAQRHADLSLYHYACVFCDLTFLHENPLMTHQAQNHRLSQQSNDDTYHLPLVTDVKKGQKPCQSVTFSTNLPINSTTPAEPWSFTDSNITSTKVPVMGSVSVSTAAANHPKPDSSSTPIHINLLSILNRVVEEGLRNSGEHSPLGSAKSPAPTSPVTATVTPMTMSNGEPAYSRPMLYNAVKDSQSVRSTTVEAKKKPTLCSSAPVPSTASGAVSTESLKTKTGTSTISDITATNGSSLPVTIQDFFNYIDAAVSRELRADLSAGGSAKQNANPEDLEGEQQDYRDNSISTSTTKDTIESQATTDRLSLTTDNQSSAISRQGSDNVISSNASKRSDSDDSSEASNSPKRLRIDLDDT